MKQEDKELLLKDLCSRLQYGVKMNHIADNEVSPITLIGINEDYIILRGGGYSYVPVEHYKPYLFPLSSITEEQIAQLEFWAFMKEYHKITNFYYENHIDFRGLIEKGLAIDCTNLNIY